MKQVILLVAFMLTLTATAAESVNISLISRSVLIEKARADDGTFTWELEISSLDDSVNNEAALAPPEIPYTHTGFFHLTDDVFGGTDVMQFGVDIPFFSDENSNGIDDFYDISASIDAVETEGEYFDVLFGQTEFFATWFRDAGLGIGIVSFDLPERDIVFDHIFRIYQFDGVFTFTRENTINLVGQVALTNIYEPADTITGPLTLRINNNEQLAYGPGTWNGPEIVYSYMPQPGDNLDRIENNYLSFLEFEDGFPYSSEVDYEFWFFNVVSTDANGDGVLDLVQGGGGTTTRPTLQVSKGPAANQITITASGTAGQTYQLQATDRLVGGTWSNLQAVTLTSTPQTITQGTTGDLRFFQLRQ